MIDPNDKSRFEPFTVHTTPYKTVDDQPIAVDVLYPTKLVNDVAKKSTPRPVIVRFHGGGLVTGGSMYPGFFSRWLLDLTLKHDAIIVSPNNQLFPESSPADVISDVTDIWKWIHASLPAFLETKESGVKVDLSQVIVTGESAGGLLALLLALEQPDGIRAVLAQYPMIDLKSAHFTQVYDKKPFGMPMTQFPASLVADLRAKAQQHQDQTGKRLIVSDDPTLTRLPAMFASLLHGFFPEYIDGRDGGEDLYVLDRLSRGEKLSATGIFVWHGKEDSLVPVQGSYELEKMFRKMNPHANFTLSVQPGEHGFDTEASLEADWIKGMVADIEKIWLA